MRTWWVKKHVVVALGVFVWMFVPGGTLVAVAETPAVPPPNIVFILCDDLGYGDLGCYGSRLIETPNIDRMAREGMRFTQAYSGASVCAPSRAALMTGLHMGHAPIRGNREIKPEGQLPLPSGVPTVAQILRQAGYATGCFGKWGLGFFGSTGDPQAAGFEDFFGYNCQRKAHEYYPEYVYRNAERVPLDGKTYSHDLITEEALKWVASKAGKPFFLYLAYTIPHAKFQVPDLGVYKDKPWTENAQKYAAMVSRMDRDVGRLFDLLNVRGIDAHTLVIFASDNGTALGAELNTFFNSNAGFRGIKRSMYEGGIRVPAIARWPGHVPAGRVVDQPWAFWDFLPTAAQLAGVPLPAHCKTDGISMVPMLEGGVMPAREFFYWELHEGNPCQAVRFGDWKAVRNSPDGALELYLLSEDPAETKNLAGLYPERVAQAETLLRKSRVDSEHFPWVARSKKGKPTGTAPAGRK